MPLANRNASFAGSAERARRTTKKNEDDEEKQMERECGEWGTNLEEIGYGGHLLAFFVEW